MDRIATLKDRTPVRTEMTEEKAADLRKAVGMDQDERHLTGVGFEAKEAPAPYGKGAKRK
jgi:hypothetical protein